MYKSVLSLLLLTFIFIFFVMVRWATYSMLGHVHSQERTFPVYNQTLVPSPDPSKPYADAHAPMYIVSGNPGNAEETSIFERGYDQWTAWR